MLSNEILSDVSNQQFKVKHRKRNPCSNNKKIESGCLKD